MKFDVHTFAVVRLKCAGIEADTHEAAVSKAMERFDDLYGLFAAQNLRTMPDGIADIEFAEEFSHFLVDRAGAEDFDASTWHDFQGRPEPFIVEQPLSAQEFRRLIDTDGRVRLAIPLSLDELYNCNGIDGFNDLVDSMLYGEGVHGCLTGVMYRPMRVLDDERVLVDVIARTDELELEEGT